MGKAIALHGSLESVISTDDQLSVQKADLAFTRLFMHATLWQTCVSHSILVLDAPLVELRFEYPLVLLATAIEKIREHGWGAMRGNGKCLVG